MIVPINPEINEAEQVSEKDRQQGAQRVDIGIRAVPSIPSTMMVMMMASTPSLNASSRFVFPSTIYLGRLGLMRNFPCGSKQVFPI